MNAIIAQKISDFTIEIFESGTKLLVAAEHHADANELIELKILVGKILGETFFLTKPIFDNYPDFLPNEFKVGNSDLNICRLNNN